MSVKTTATSTTALTQAPPQTNHVDVLAGLENFFGNIVGTIKNGITVATSSAIPQVSTGNIVSGTVGDAQTAVAEIEAIIADIKAKKWTATAKDVLHLITTVFGILARFGINIPGATQALTIATEVATVIP